MIDYDKLAEQVIAKKADIPSIGVPDMDFMRRLHIAMERKLGYSIRLSAEVLETGVLPTDEISVQLNIKYTPVS